MKISSQQNFCNRSWVKRLQLLLLLMTAFSALACASSRESLGAGAMAVVSEGVVNDPTNKSLRFDILRYGLETFCLEMRQRSVPIRLQDASPITGRFFADGCNSQVIDRTAEQGVIVRFQGAGYTWTNMTQRLGFTSSGNVNYAVDFQRHSERLYVYFRPRQVRSVTFKPTLVESPLAQVGIALSGINPEQIGKDLLTGQLQRGFTVIRYPGRGETEFAMGVIPPGERPILPYSAHGSDWTTLVNNRTSVQLQQQDYIRGLHVPDTGGKLRLTAQLEGARAVDVFVVPAGTGQQMVARYLAVGGPAQLLRPPAADLSLVRGRPLQTEIRLLGGDYFLVIDHSGAAGRSSPPAGEPPATIDYLVQFAP